MGFFSPQSPKRRRRVLQGRLLLFFAMAKRQGVSQYPRGHTRASQKLGVTLSRAWKAVTYAEASPTSWQRTLVGWSKPTMLSRGKVRGGEEKRGKVRGGEEKREKGGGEEKRGKGEEEKRNEERGEEKRNGRWGEEKRGKGGRKEKRWHLVPLSNLGYLRPRGWPALACDPSPRPDLSTQRRRWCQWRLACLPRMEVRWR